MLRLGRRTTGLLGLTLLAMVGTTVPASADTYGAISNVYTGYCLGIWQNSTAPGTNAVQWGCNGNRDQQWHWDGTHLITGDGQCLGIWQGSTGEAANAVQWPCNGNLDQSWYRYTTTINGNFGYEYQNRNSGLCLQPRSTSEGSVVVQLDCGTYSVGVWN